MKFNITIPVTYILMRLSFIECTLFEVRTRQYQSQNKKVVLFDEVDLCDEKLAFIKSKTEEVKCRRDGVDTKARTLLSLTSLLLGLISSTTGIASSKTIGIWSVFPLTMLFITIFLLAIYFGIDRSQTTDYSCLFLEKRLARKTLCDDLISTQIYNDSVTDFMVDLYRSALRYFSFAMLLIMFLGVGNIILN